MLTVTLYTLVSLLYGTVLPLISLPLTIREETLSCFSLLIVMLYTASLNFLVIVRFLMESGRQGSMVSPSNEALTPSIY